MFALTEIDEVEKNLFKNRLPDLDRFAPVNLSDNDKPIYLCHPVCYFFLKDKKMVPVAIHLTSHEEDPIFTPKDSTFERVQNFV